MEQKSRIYFEGLAGGAQCTGAFKTRCYKHKLNSIIIAMTGYFRDKESEISIATVTANLGADYTLKKPLDIEKVLTIIEKN